MKRLLLIGDMHVITSELEECQKLVNWVDELSVKYSVDTQVFLGDQFNNHNIVDIRVSSFWLDYLNKDRSSTVMFLTGNHDYANSKDINSRHALESFKNLKNTIIVDKPIVINNILFLPYYYDNKEFIKLCSDYPSTGLICHQSFNGLKYENGFPISDGVNLDYISQTWVCSGHIHLQQTWGKLKYIGSPRWRTASDTNQEKSLLLIDIDENTGNILNEIVLDTSNILIKMLSLKDTEDNQVKELQDNIKYIIDIKGTKEYINRRKNELKLPNVRVRTFITNTSQASVKESEGISVAFGKFFDGFDPPNKSNKEQLLKLVKERLKF